MNTTPGQVCESSVVKCADIHSKARAPTSPPPQAEGTESGGECTYPKSCRQTARMVDVLPVLWWRAVGELDISHQSH